MTRASALFLILALPALAEEGLSEVISAQICESAGWYKKAERQCYRAACDRVSAGPRDGTLELALGRCLSAHGSAPRTAQALTWAAQLGAPEVRREAYEALRRLPTSVYPAGLVDDDAVHCGQLGISISSCERSFNVCTVTISDGAMQTERAFVAYELRDAFSAATGESAGAAASIELAVREGASCRVQCSSEKTKRASAACVKACQKKSVTRRAACRIVFADACDGRVAITCDEGAHNHANRELEVPKKP